ncbi:hypothetical protein ORJ04_22550 [Rheinheimera baltica]|uniref:Uncharacterized protein n=1 Tax=Rheinheimera baltica TaxID=67576 RepID=A0ABT9I5R7_9GAMM|nr:hypothetical protein [Rheinheimera baltica]MDP5138730.1 hypothetical protein [Rheinheimera baltica]MDP5142553.1 hypothetical protein [Rheinheimera baltica]
MERFDKLDIADEMLESAIESYLDNEKYFSSLHLAGAAQEIYGKWLRINGGQDFSTMMLNQAEKIFDEPINRKSVKKEDKRSKNSIKHMDNKSDRFTDLQPQMDSFMAISEAVAEYLMLQRPETSNITRFKNYLISTKENGL